MPPANTTGNPLSAASLSTLMVTSIPKDADPGIKNPYEAVALAAHAGFIAVGFRLIGLGEEHKIGESELHLMLVILHNKFSIQLDTEG